jgi:uncharacterized protein (DUF1501 family)
MNKKMLSRRNVLKIAAAAGGISMLNLAIPTRSSMAGPSGPPPLFIWLTMSGAWDQLLAFDPRPNDDPKYRTASATTLLTPSGIRPAYDMVLDAEVRKVVAARASGVRTAGALSFGPAVPGALFEGNKYKDFAIVRGMDMNTVAHEVGRRYTLTGKAPRGASASGSSVATLVAGQVQPPLILPHVVLNTETYNEGQPGFASGTRAVASNLFNLLRVVGTNYGEGERDALVAFQEGAASCDEVQANRDGFATMLRENNKRAHTMLQSNVAADFNFNPATATGDQAALLAKFNIGSTADVNGPRGRMLAIAQLFANNLTTAVSAVLADSLDDHDDWHVDHATKLRVGFEALSDLVDFLQATKDAAGNTLWSRTTLMLSSEFSRTPLLNAREGRDHHITNSALIAGPGIAGNQVFGATTDNGMQRQKISPLTGRVDASGVYIRPTDIVATLLKSMGMSTDPLSNNTPVILPKLLKAV